MVTRRGFFASVAALLAATNSRTFSRHTPGPVVAPVKRFDYGAPSVFHGDWNVHGTRYHASTYAAMIPLDPRLLEGATWVFPGHRENI
jgi:hypothetical protein